MCAPRLKTELTAFQQFIQATFIRPGMPLLAFENMPGRCFIGDRRLQSFTENIYCSRGKLLSVLQVPIIIHLLL